jgi:hypothetical protein
MPALAPDTLDTLVTLTATFSFDIEFRAQFVGSPPTRNGLDFNGSALDAILRTRSGGGDFGRVDLGFDIDSAATVDVVLTSPPGDATTDTVLATGAGVAVGTPGFLAPITCSYSIGPLRLGVRYEWWSDAATVTTYIIGGITVVTFGAAPANLGCHPGSLSYGLLSLDSALTTSAFSMFRVSNLRYNAVAVSGGPFEFGYLSGAGAFRHLGATRRWSVNLGTIDADGTSIAANATHNGGTRSMGATAYTEEIQGAGVIDNAAKFAGAAVLTDPWLSAQAVTPYTPDRTFFLEGNNPVDPNASKTSWSVGTITIASPVSVLQSATAWTVMNGTVTVGGTSTVPTFLVTVGPARVERLFYSDWRDWNNPVSGLYQPTDLYTATKRTAYATSATNDVWGWGLYAYLDVDMTCPAVGGPHVLAFEVDWAVVSDLGATIDTITTTYSPVTFTDGARSTQRIDLLFPVEYRDIPYYGERVDAVRIVGLQVAGGAYTLHSISLVADQQAYAKIGGQLFYATDGVPIYGGVVLAQDASMPSSLWGLDYPLTGDRNGDGYPDHRGDDQNGRFLVNEVGYSFLGHAQAMEKNTLLTAFAELSLMEGVTATYSATAIDAAFTDTFGAVLDAPSAFRPATWFVPTLPHARITKNVAYTVLAQLVVTDIALPNGLSSTSDLIVYERARLGMAIEALALSTSDTRAAPGGTVNARASFSGSPAPGDLLLATAVTDASGFVTLPIRTGLIGGVEFWAYLTDS